MKKKLPKVKTVKTKTWNALSKYVRARDKQCVTCKIEGKWEPATQAGHYRHNTDKPTQNLGGNELWYNEKNINGQCASCNLYKSGNLVPYAIYMQKTYGDGILDEIQALWLKPKKWSREELKEKEEYFKEKLLTLSTSISTE